VLKSELKQLIVTALTNAGATLIDQTPAHETEYFDYEIQHPDLPGGRLSARFFAWGLTADKSASGRPMGEHKIQLTLGDRKTPQRNFPTADGRQNFLLGYSQDYQVFVGFQAELHRDFGWSKLVACREEALEQAHGNGWATHLRGRSPNTGQRELAIAFQPDKIIDWLRFQLARPDLYGPARQYTANSWPTVPVVITETEGTPVEEIVGMKVREPTAEEIAQEDEELQSIGGDIQVSTTTETATVNVNIADRIAATNRHNQIILAANNRAHDFFGPDAHVIDRDIPNYQRTYPGATLQPDLGLRYILEGEEDYVVLEAKSLPDNVSGKWQRILKGIGDVARYSMIYEERFQRWPVRILALEYFPDDESMQRFLRNLWDNEDICVIWREGEGFRTFSSHHEKIHWLAEPLESEQETE
jgi:hypothetical protein